MTHTTTSRDKCGVYHCAGDMWGQWTGCLDMRVRGALAEDDVAEQFLARCAFTIVTRSEARAGSPRALWAGASLEERKRLLGAVVERIVVTPLGIDVPHAAYRTTLRHELRIEWKADLNAGEQIVVVADEPEIRAEHRVSEGRHQRLRATESGQAVALSSLPSSAGKTWAQWQIELRQVRQPQ